MWKKLWDWFVSQWMIKIEEGMNITATDVSEEKVILHVESTESRHIVKFPKASLKKILKFFKVKKLEDLVGHEAQFYVDWKTEKRIGLGSPRRDGWLKLPDDE